jgi:hypothetical protein
MLYHVAQRRSFQVAIRSAGRSVCPALAFSIAMSPSFTCMVQNLDMRMCVACAPFSRSRSREPAQHGRGAARGVAGADCCKSGVYGLLERGVFCGWGLSARVWSTFLPLLRGVVWV